MCERKSAAAVVFGMPGQVQQLSSPPPGAKEDLSDSEKEEEGDEVKEEQAGCYTNGSFFLESRNKLTRWLSHTDMAQEEVEKVKILLLLLLNIDDDMNLILMPSKSYIRVGALLNYK